VDSVPFWKPWGPGLVAPVLYPEEGEEVEPVAGDPLLTRKMRRSHSWGGYTTYSQQNASAAAKLDEGHEQVFQKMPSADDVQVKSPTTLHEPSTPILLGNVKNKKWTDHRPTPILALKPGIQESTAAQTVFANNAKSLKAPKSPKSPKTKGRRSGKGRLSSTSPVGSADGSISPGGRSSPGARSCRSGSISPGGSPVVSGPITTLMIRNLPHSLTQPELLDEVDSCGYAGFYDFCYLPHKFAKHKNLGFAFLNFVSTDVAATFRQQWHLSRRFATTLNVSAAAVQGRKANEEKAASQKMSRVRNPCYKPMVFENAAGRQASLCASESSPSSPVTPLQQWKGQLLTAAA